MLELKSWREVVTVLHNILSHLSCPMLNKLVIGTGISIFSPTSNLSLDDWDRDFAMIDLAPIHALQDQKSLRNLREVQVTVEAFAPRGTSEATISQAKLARKLRLILQPWDQRGILTLNC